MTETIDIASLNQDPTRPLHEVVDIGRPIGHVVIGALATDPLEDGQIRSRAHNIDGATSGSGWDPAITTHQWG